jgi:MYXO-CTERM domain-containing protein
MYARLDRGHTHQRSIELDDEDGAMTVYAGPATTPTAMGCSASGAGGGGTAGFGLLFFVGLVLIRRASMF